MNRAERRNMTKRLKRMKATSDEIDRIISLYDDGDDTIPEGSKVKIDYDKITSYSDYVKKLPKYKETVENLKDKICTVCYDGSYQKHPKLVCLEEDDRDPKWLFFVGDLIVVEKPQESVGETEKPTVEPTDEVVVDVEDFKEVENTEEIKTEETKEE